MQVALLKEIHDRIYRDTFKLRVAEWGGLKAHEEAEHHARNTVDIHLKHQIRTGTCDDNQIVYCETFDSNSITSSRVLTSRAAAAPPE